jgi:hypothetical protein
VFLPMPSASASNLGAPEIYGQAWGNAECVGGQMQWPFAVVEYFHGKRDTWVRCSLYVNSENALITFLYISTRGAVRRIASFLTPVRLDEAEGMRLRAGRRDFLGAGFQPLKTARDVAGQVFHRCDWAWRRRSCSRMPF